MQLVEGEGEERGGEQRDEAPGDDARGKFDRAAVAGYEEETQR